MSDSAGIVVSHRGTEINISRPNEYTLKKAGFFPNLNTTKFESDLT
jgi:hypothetical protein